MMIKQPFKNVAVGGTFDKLHKGHKTLLNKAFEVGNYVYIGLTSDEFVLQLQKTHKVAPYNERLTDLTNFLKTPEFKNRFEISPLHTPYGLTLNQTTNLDALIVSQETIKTAETINKKRLQTNLPPLHIVKINLVPAENKTPISTTRIRANEIDKEGHLIKQNQPQK
ncbi:MAG: phosphopantetheine adenylyltransferase [Candidatus Bathyarchaeota archaeon]|nr:phosphopantetheine adenylyltransferase [Candidatus Termiticorpusculum sp.]